MRKLTALILLAAAMIVAATSCEERLESATLRVSLQRDRSIVPESYPMEVTSYRISGEGPETETFSVETSKESVSLEGLVIGDWHILAEGLNTDGDVLVTGETDHRLTGTNGSCTIVLSELVGEGSLSVVLNWNPDRISDEPSIEIELTPQYGGGSPASIDRDSFSAADGSAAFSGEGYPAGSYILAARLYDGTVQVAGFVEAVRIAGDQESAAVIEFDLDRYPTEPGTLELVNSTGVPVVCTIEGISDTVDADIPITVSMESATQDTSGFLISWYLDGNLIGEGPETEFTPIAGTHRLDVVASTSRIGTTGSASVNFEALQATAEGVPSHGSLIEDSEDLPLSGQTIVRFLPDGRAMIVSNAERKVQIASIIRNSLNVDRSYTFEAIGIDGDAVDFTSLRVSDSLSKVLMSLENPYRTIVFNYNPSTQTLTKFSEGTPKALLNETDEYDISGIGGVAVTDGLRNQGCGVGAVLVQKADTGKWQQIYVTLGGSTGSNGYYWQGMNLGIGSDAATPVGGLHGSSGSFFHASREGMLLYAGKDNSSTSFNLVGHVVPSYMFPSDKDKFQDLTTAALLGPENMMVIGDYMILLEYSPTGDNWGWEMVSATAIGHEARSLTVTPDYGYAYYIDIDTDEVVALEVSFDARSVEEIGRTALPHDGIDSLAVSFSGRSLIAYDASSASSLTVMRIQR